jgi:hypothetical protein
LGSGFGILVLALTCALTPPAPLAQAPEIPRRGELLKYNGPWRFQSPRDGAAVFTTDAQFERYVSDAIAADEGKAVPTHEFADPVRGGDNFLESVKTVRGSGGDTMKLFFDYFYRKKASVGVEDAPRRYMPDSDAYIEKIATLSHIAQKYNVGFSLSFLSPLEIGAGYTAKTGETGSWLQYRKGVRDPVSGEFSVQLWRQTQWSNNKGVIQIQPGRVRVFAFKETPVVGTIYRVVDPSSIVEITQDIHVEEYPNLVVRNGDMYRHDPGSSPHASEDDFHAQRIRVYGSEKLAQNGLDHVLVVQQLITPEMDYFSPKALPYLENLVDRYVNAGVKLNGLYADEMHIQGDWVKKGHEDDGEFDIRYVTDSLAEKYALLYGAQYRDFAKYLVYFTYAQDDTSSTMYAKQGVMHVFGSTPEDIRRTALFRARYYHLLNNQVVDLFTQAKDYAERKVGHRLDAPNHATWAQSPTMDYFATENEDTTHAEMYDYTSNFIWSNSVQQASVAAHDYFKWGDFLTGNGSDYAEGGWLDRDYYGLAISTSLGIINQQVPYAYAVSWGFPMEVVPLRQALVDAYGDRGAPIFQNVQNAEHRDIDVLTIYPMDLVATEERYGSWMTQYGYTNYISEDKLLELAKVQDGTIEMAGRRFHTLAVVFEPFPSENLLAMMRQFVQGGGRLIWSGPPPVLTFSGEGALPTWEKIFGVSYTPMVSEGKYAAGMQVTFSHRLSSVPPQIILTDMLPDHIYPVTPDQGVQAVAQMKRWTVGSYKTYPGGGTATYLGFRPRDDQSASLGYDERTWFDVLLTLGAYPATGKLPGVNDNTEVVARTSDYLVTRFPNGALSFAHHLRTLDETWNGGGELPKSKPADFVGNPLPANTLHLAAMKVDGHSVSYDGTGAMAFREDAGGRIVAFAGGGSREITVDGRRTVFADRQLKRIGWAPVAAMRRVPGGAMMQIVADGEGEVSIQAPSVTSPISLVMEGPVAGSRGPAVPFTLRGGVLRFALTPALSGHWIYVVPNDASASTAVGG